MAGYYSSIKARVLRFLRGEFQELFESITSGAPTQSGRGGEGDHRSEKAKRALLRACQGSVPKAFRALVGGGTLPLEKGGVRLAFAGPPTSALNPCRLPRPFVASRGILPNGEMLNEIFTATGAL